MSSQKIKEQIRNWIASKNPKVDSSTLTNSTPLLAQKLIGSVQMLDLILFIESLGSNELEAEKLTPESFATIDMIYQSFFE